MGLIVCSKHGETGFMPFVSKELSDEMLKGKRFSSSHLAQVEVVLIDEEDGEVMHTMYYLMTKDCFFRINAKSRYEIRTDDDEKNLDSIFDPVMKGGGICGECFRDCIIK
ncbi:hypothetical protein DWB84_14530 [Saccharophagus sp. K07]|uniref:hypothetical protein n=1 Tax=Saccharophagus sp. K07 TaxID=2283636 RepID=UPI0016528886|nr:hypothetical protein [Saccharophagus sp. K07]MBC6906666.1 hypothetical protein [Saccharophagus sp. K07]